MQIVEVTKNKGEICAKILAVLPHWFGMPASNEAYRRDVEVLPMFGVVDENDVVAFLALKRQSPHAQEIHVMGVRQEHHRSGMGRALIERAERHAREQGARFLTVKTLSASDPDPGYAKTRAFYEAMAFVTVAELPELGGPENPTVLMLKVLG
jgi:GNAT superfamily N-acetyltransferase